MFKLDIFNILHRLTIPVVEQENEEPDEEEIAERNKLMKVANKVLRFLGLVCIQEVDHTGI